ncbi:MAG: serine hydrolase [Bacteroidetes bacterium]|nr:serine hydrolase [Bacteroidota bacterium]
MKLLLSSLFILLFPLASVAQSELNIDSLASSVLKTFDVPGVAIAVVQDGKVLLESGFGVKTSGKQDRVDENTLFGIASNSKAFTASALAILVDEGRLSWDDPVIKYLPDFQLYDPWVTREITVRDLLCHRSGLGLGAGDLMVFPTALFTPEEIIRNMKTIKPASSFRSTYAYNNLMFLVAGSLIPAITDTSWTDFIKERFFKPLGMANSYPTFSAIKGKPNQSSYHVWVDGKLQVTPGESMDNCAPAGGINSSVHDLTKWMIMQLDSGLVRNSASGKSRLISKKQYRQLWSTQFPFSPGPPPPGMESLKTQYAGYALGWNVRQYRGYQMVSHTGGLTGMVTRLTLIPEKKLGIVVLTNQESSEAFNSLTFSLLDHYMGMEPANWTEKFKAMKDSSQAKNNRFLAKLETDRNKKSKPSLSAEGYTGIYKDSWMGDMVIKLNGENLTLQFEKSPTLTGKLIHWQYDTFIVKWDHRYLRADAFVTFSLNPDGSVDQVKMSPVSPDTDFSFDFQDLELRRQ